MSEQAPTKDQLATPTVAGQYSSTCLGCNRQMEWADKRCRICTDCDKPQEQRPSKERDEAIAIANRWLDEPMADPDDDFRTLARQFLCATERAAPEQAKDVNSRLAEWRAAAGRDPLGVGETFVALLEIAEGLQQRLIDVGVDNLGDNDEYARCRSIDDEQIVREAMETPIRVVHELGNRYDVVCEKLERAAAEPPVDWKRRAETAEGILNHNMALANATTRRAMEERNGIIRKMRERYSAMEIADMAGLTRQRVHQILNEAPIEPESSQPPVIGCIHDSAPMTLCEACYPPQPPSADDLIMGRGDGG
jgi:hypothetical protein